MRSILMASVDFIRIEARGIRPVRLVVLLKKMNSVFQIGETRVLLPQIKMRVVFAIFCENIIEW